MYVCVCNAVTEQDIFNAVAEGCASLRQLREQLGVCLLYTSDAADE